jgi:tetratricopeptide (TPR) repeat protein
VEERFDNLMTKADALAALGRKDEEAAVRAKATGMASATQLYYYGRQLQSQGQQAQAFEFFRSGLKRYPDHWVAHLETARLASAEGNFDKAASEVKLAATGAPAALQSSLEALVRRLEAKQDINQ